MNRLPLEGVRVADFSWVWAGPYCSLLLGMMGAEVIKFESRRRLDAARNLYPAAYVDPDVHKAYVEWQSIPAAERGPFAPGRPNENQSGYFNRLNMAKLSTTLDLSKPEAIEIAKKVIGLCDVVIENFAPRVMKGLGLDYDSLREVRPDVVYISMSGNGATGPDRDFVLYGAPQVAASGLASLTGYVGGPPMPVSVSYGDPMAGLHGAFAILAALHHRTETGEGQHIDMSQWESTICLLPEGMMEYMMNGRVLPRMGNRDPIMAPHDVFPCRGDDKWIAIAVGCEEEWRGLCEAMGNPEWARDARFADMYSRWHHQDELNGRLSEWTAGFEAYELMAVLQKVGVAATPSLDNAEVVNDPHLNERGFFQQVDHPETGPRVHPGSPIYLNETPAEIFRAPLLGEHNERVFGNLLGMAPEEIERLIQEKVIF